MKCLMITTASIAVSSMALLLFLEALLLRKATQTAYLSRNTLNFHRSGDGDNLEKGGTIGWISSAVVFCMYNVT